MIKNKLEIKRSVFCKKECKAFLILVVVSLIVPFPLKAIADEFRGIEFPQGMSSFADKVINYNPSYSGGNVPTEPAAIDPNVAIGSPDFPINGSVGDIGAVSLGSGGLIELEFIDNDLTNSGNDGKYDIHIFEVGADIEDTFVAIRPTTQTLRLLEPSGDVNGDGFFEVGKVFGSISSIDIDNFFPGFSSGTLHFDAIQLIDDPSEGGDSGTTVGADVDSVGAISSSACADNYISTITPNLDIFLPSLNYQSLTDTSNLWVELEFYGEESNNLLWKIKDFGVNTGSAVGCTPEDSIIVSSNLDIHLLSIDYQLLSGTLNFWANFEYYGLSSEGELLWKLIYYGENQ